MKQPTNIMLTSGKIPASLLTQLLSNLPTSHPQLLLGPAVGEDAAVIDFAPGQDQLLVAKSDPITFATDAIGYYAVNVCANDLAVTGATPRFYLPTVLLPAGQADEALAQRIFHQIGAACRSLGIVVVGGHSEVTPTVNQAVVAGTMLGDVARGHVIHSGGCQPGDLVLMAGMAPVEGISIIAREKRAELLQRGWPTKQIELAANYLYEPGISVMTPARLAAQTGLVTAMHDPTEGGIATAILELTLAADVGLEFRLDSVNMPALAQQLCAEFGLDPLGVIASGALLATTPPEHAATILQSWRQHGWAGTIIGQILPKAAGLVAIRQGERVEFPRFASDEITKLWQ